MHELGTIVAVFGAIAFFAGLCWKQPWPIILGAAAVFGGMYVYSFGS